MEQNLKYFMRADAKTEKTIFAQAPDSFKDDEGNPINMEIRILSHKRIMEINDLYTERKMATDKKGNPIVAGGEVVFRTIKDNMKAHRHLMVESLKFPDLRDPELMKYYECHDMTDMPMHVFSTSEEFTYVSRIINVALGLREPGSEDELKLSDVNSEDIENAKN